MEEAMQDDELERLVKALEEIERQYDDAHE